MRYLCVLFLLLSSNVWADATDFVQTFISDQYVRSSTGMVSDSKSGELVGFVKIGTNNHYAVHWIFRAANLWEHRITIISPEGNGYKEFDTIRSKGKIKNITANDGILVLFELGYEKHTPRCCPDKEIVNKYRINSGKLIKVDTN